MPIDVKHRVVGILSFISLGFGSLGLVGCGGEADSPPSQEAGEPVESAEVAEAEETERERVEYTDPSQADDSCEVAEGLVALDEEAADQEEEAAVAQLGERLELFAGAAGRFAEFAPDAESKSQWEEVDLAYSEAHSFYLSAGEQVANDHFLLLLAEAVDAGSEAFEAQQEEVQEECGVDLSQLVPEE